MRMCTYLEQLVVAGLRLELAGGFDCLLELGARHVCELVIEEIRKLRVKFVYVGRVRGVGTVSNVEMCGCAEC
jgi:hypothetical protein